MTLKKNEMLDDLGVSDMFENKVERMAATKLIKKYITQYVIENVSDRNTLKQLVYLEIYHVNRLQKIANDEYEKHGTNNPKILRNIHENLEQILKLKNSLALIQSDRNKSDTFKAFETLKKKFKIWRENNQGSRTTVCPHCSKMIMLKIRMDAWEAQKHPYFKDRLIGNQHLIDLYKEKKLTKQDIAKILQTSSDYIEWLISKW